MTCLSTHVSDSSDEHETSDDDDDSTTKMSDEIVKSFSKSTFDNRSEEYLSENKIRAFVTKDAITNELALGIGDDELRDWIFTRSPRVFLAVIQCEDLPWVRRQVLMGLKGRSPSGFDDENLPAKNVTGGKIKRHPFKIGPWNNGKVHDFCTKQWRYLAPVFGPHRYDYNLQSGVIFPFELCGKKPRQGAFSEVIQVRIHREHNKHSGINEVAIKVMNQVGDDSAWEVEARALSSISKLNHTHIIKCLAAIRRGDRRYFMFPWANGDSLREFWEKTQISSPRKDIIDETIFQFRGLADALVKLHNFQNEKGDDSSFESDIKTEGPTIMLNAPQTNEEDAIDELNEYNEYGRAGEAHSVRHGDLKPENILRFTDERKPSGIGTLKIADLGLAKRHFMKTQDRSQLTSTRYSTLRYEAPETRVLPQVPRSRQYDIWSMGCITLEFIIWILYGNSKLKTFYDQLRGRDQQECPFFEISEDKTQATLHRVVLRWMDHIQNMDPECSGPQESAIGDLLNIVRTKLLVVDLPPSRGTVKWRGRQLQPSLGLGPKIFRATASEFRKALDEIREKANKPNYLVTGNTREGVSPPVNVSSENRSLSAADGEMRRQTTGINYSLPAHMDRWEFPVDNKFATKVLEKVGPLCFKPKATEPARLCNQCEHRDFWKGGFFFHDTVPDMEKRAEECRFCEFLLRIYTRRANATGSDVLFERQGSTLVIPGSHHLPVISFVRPPDSNIPTKIQLGFSELPDTTTTLFYDVIKLWLEDCDNNTADHKDCHTSTKDLPTRLIDVGIGDKTLRLLEKRESQIVGNKYIALSHPWGDKEKHPPFSTLRKNVDVFKKAIPYESLPATFRDAVIATRALGIRYLWIDSICIIQGPDGDFVDEASRMEDVFSGAYCVLAASRATGQRDGFLQQRPRRQYLTFQRGPEELFYACEPIDDFTADVLDGGLNKRGWVLQERALARRTVYFTERQTYFECGYGVRCETLSRMENKSVAFLGDPKFPDKAMNTKSRGEKIHYFQELYRQYSRLDLSWIQDRPIAIAGLEIRLQQAFNTRGCYGMFHNNFFHRSLLWQRGNDEKSLQLISFPNERKTAVPSWSWMAYKGGIDYCEPPFESVDWEETEIHPPVMNIGFSLVKSAWALEATVRDFSVADRARDDNELDIIYDMGTERTADKHRTQCVIVARSKGGGPKNTKRHYVLLVCSTGATTPGGHAKYKRIGVGYMLGKYITLGGSGIQAKIF